MTGSLASLVKQLDKKMAKNDKLKGFVVITTEDADKVSGELEAFAKKNNIKHLPLTVYEGATGPRSYKIAKDADVTVMMWVGLEVKSNHSFAKGKLDKKGIAKVLKDLPKILEN